MSASADPKLQARILRHLARAEPLDATLGAFPELTRDELVATLEGIAEALAPAPKLRLAPPPVTAAPLKPGGEPVLRVFSDGAARGNPGPAGAGAVLTRPDGEVVERLGKFLGRQTNNHAEYMGLIIGLRRAQELGAREVEVYADSQLMIRQLGGRYQVKSPTLRPLYDEAMAMLKGFAKVKLVHVPREMNGAADEMSNRAIDERLYPGEDAQPWRKILKMASRTLFRPVGLRELELILEADARAFPPRLPEQPIFYPVLNFGYAAQIARDWNTPDADSGYAGFVTQFTLDESYLSQFEEKTVGAAQHKELWVPAERLSEFNARIEGPIRTTHGFYGPNYQGPTPLPCRIRSSDPLSQLKIISGILAGNETAFAQETTVENWKLVHCNFGFWSSTASQRQGLSENEASHTLQAIRSAWEQRRLETPLPSGQLVPA